MSRANVSLKDALLTLSVFFVLSVLVLHFSSSFAHNNSITVIPISRNPIEVDGILTTQEWSDAYQQNLTSAGIPTQYTTLYLKYDFSQKALEGAFDIPDETPSTTKGNLDQISFQFDTTHDASESINLDEHFIVITRDKGVEYYIGDPTTPEQIRSINNFTQNSSSSNELQVPFSRIDFKVNSNNSDWTAEFRIYFQSEFRDSIGFAMQQFDFHPVLDAVSGDYNYTSNHANFPIINRTLAYHPSTWGDLRVADLYEIIQNVKSLCPSGNNLPFSVESNILCITGLNRNQMSENDPAQIIVSGRFANFISNSGIENEQIHVNIVDPVNMLQSAWEGDSQPGAVTRSDGRFEYQLEDVTLPKGNYFVKIEPISAKYKGLNATIPLVVNERALSLDDIAGYIQLFVGVIGGIIGVVVGVPSVLKFRLQRKQKSVLHEHMKKINDIYYDLANDKEDLLIKLKEERITILNLLANGKIDEEQFRMLDGKISEYEQKSGDGYKLESS